MALASVAGAMIVVPKLASTPFNIRICLLWMIAAIVYFLVQEPAVVYVFAAAVILSLAPRPPLGKVAVYIGIAAMLPFSFGWAVPFPGINFLLTLLPGKLVALCLLVPALIAAGKNQRVSTLPVIVLVIFCVYGSLILGPQYSATAISRFAVDQLLVYALPFAAILTVVRTDADIETCVDAFIMASVIMVGVAAMSTLKQWNFYSFSIFVDERAGLLRVTGTASVHSLGMHLAAGLLLVEATKERLKLRWLQLWALRTGFLLGLLVTGSRGAQAGAMVGLAFYIALTASNPVFRRLLSMVSYTAIAAGCAWLVLGDVTNFDSTGNFSYRQELLRTAVGYLAERPFFGDFDFARSGRFDHLIQGQQIIDITNFYLQIALSFGVIGLALLFYPFAVATWRVFRSLKLDAGREKDPMYKLRIALLCSLISWYVVAATTSDFGITVHVGIVLGALCFCAARRTSPVEQSDTASASLHPSARWRAVEPRTS